MTKAAQACPPRAASRNKESTIKMARTKTIIAAAFIFVLAASTAQTQGHTRTQQC
jgi:hypothetical protein